MHIINSFLETEKTRAGWRFWIVWVVLTYIGFFVGLTVSELLSSRLGYRLLSATISAVIIGFFTGLTQSVALSRHKISRLGWIAATTIGWTAGIMMAGLIIFNIFPYVLVNNLFYWILPSAFVAGFVVGIAQMFILWPLWRGKSIWWIPISTVGWGIQFPGIFPGLFLARWLKSNKQE
ncbi:MAG: hypothetical protein R3293_03600 [Candidatus Promineifilaceae bacterium]|nr:hypothetical protein [Candidatus Promineifilaceae bacterium]